MSNRKEKKDIKMTVFIMVAGICLMVAGIFGIVTSRIDSREYKASTDIRKISAVIDDPANEAGAVKTGAWGAAAPHIRHT